jgi:hypothetical protein
MAIDFPASPTLNDVFTVGNVTYVWDGTKWTASVTGGISLDKIEEGNTSAEVIDTGSDGRFVVTTEGTGRLFVDASGNVGINRSVPQSGLDIRPGAPGTLNAITMGYGRAANPTDAIHRIQWTSDDLFIEADTANTITSNIRFYNDGTEKMVLDSAGRLGIGTSSPSSTLHVAGPVTINNGDAINELTFAGTEFTNIYSLTTSGFQLGTTGSGYLALLTSNSERLRITSAGLVGIGTSSPGSRLEIGGDSSYDATITFNRVPVQPTNDAVIGELFFQNNADSVALIAVKRESAADDAYIQFATQQTTGGLSEKLRITSAGRVGIGTTSPGGPLGVQVDTGKDVTVGLTSGSPMITYRNGSGAWFHVGKHPTSDALIFSNGATTTTSEMARFDNAGRLLVGTSSAVSTQWAPNLQVVGADTPCSFVLARNDTTVAVNTTLAAIRAFGNSSSGPYEECSRISTEADGDHGPGDKPTRLAFWTTADGASTPTERMRIASNGIIVARNSVGDTLNLYNAASAGTSNAFIYGAHSSASAYTGTTSFVVWTNGNVVNTNGSYTTISDAKLKENIVSAGSQWNDIKAIQIRNWNFKAETGNETHRQIGPIAQEVEAVCPGLVFEIPDRDQDGNETGEVTKGINQSVLYMKAVKALQEAIAKIETLEGMVAVNNITIDEQQHQLSTLAARLTALENA